MNQHDLALVKSQLVQAYGTFSGKIQLPEGELILQDVPGVCEDQAVLW
jgi:hypothetical protein